MLEALQARVTLSGAAFASQGKLFNLLSLQQKQPEMVEQFLYPMSWCFWTKFCLGEHLSHFMPILNFIQEPVLWFEMIQWNWFLMKCSTGMNEIIQRVQFPKFALS